MAYISFKAAECQKRGFPHGLQWVFLTKGNGYHKHDTLFSAMTIAFEHGRRKFWMLFAFLHYLKTNPRSILCVLYSMLQ